MCACHQDGDNSLKKMWIGLAVWVLVFAAVYGVFCLLGGANAVS